MSEQNHTVLPRHVAIIMDGNGRWAKSRGLPRLSGHHKGAESVRKTVTSCRERGIKVLTLFAFSSQNWSRPSLEVNGLMSLLNTYIHSERDTILDNNIKLVTIGETNLLPDATRNSLDALIEESCGNTGMTLCLCLSYGGREEILAMVRDVAAKTAIGELDPNLIDMDTIQQSLWSSSLGPVDLMIRTSGELRVSNFLLFSLAYSELFFTDLMWPEFDESVLDEALESYASRQRRFGKIS